MPSRHAYDRTPPATTPARPLWASAARILAGRFARSIARRPCVGGDADMHAMPASIRNPRTEMTGRLWANVSRGVMRMRAMRSAATRPCWNRFLDVPNNDSPHSAPHRVRRSMPAMPAWNQAIMRFDCPHCRVGRHTACTHAYCRHAGDDLAEANVLVGFPMFFGVCHLEASREGWTGLRRGEGLQFRERMTGGTGLLTA